jgi:hypothetical protein
MESNSLNFLTVNIVSQFSNTYLIRGNIYSVHGMHMHIMQGPVGNRVHD